MRDGDGASMTRRWAIAGLWIAALIVGAMPMGAQSSSDLQGSRWGIVEVFGETLPQEESPYVAFETDGRLSGRTACNWFHGTYSVDADAIVILTRLTTLRGCVIDNKRRSDATLEALDSSARFAVAGSVLTLSDGGGEPVARLERRSDE
jgi:heat shock protein HslJ